MEASSSDSDPGPGERGAAAAGGGGGGTGRDSGGGGPGGGRAFVGTGGAAAWDRGRSVELLALNSWKHVALHVEVGPLIGRAAPCCSASSFSSKDIAEVCFAICARLYVH